MNFSPKSEVKNLLKKYQLRPSKGLGQNFLVDKRAIRKIIEAAELRSEDIILEVGPGLGALTQELAKRVKKIIAVEKDPNLARILNKELKIKDVKNVEIVQGDILKILNSTTAPFQRAGLPSSYLRAAAKFLIPNSYKVVANLPFYLTALVIRKFLEADVQPKLLVLIIQKEVAQRICPYPPKLKERRRGKTPKMNLLAVSVQIYAEPKIISYISKKSFWPQPEVDAAIIKLKVKSQRLKFNRDLFFKIVKAGFCQPRKQILNNLANGLKLDKEVVKNWLLKNSIQPRQRAETLSIEDWLKLTKNFK
jgi:16S rRNA (adenine1518-N6/adenine1519-N6)-dimethyltransferase